MGSNTLILSILEHELTTMARPNKRPTAQQNGGDQVFMLGDYIWIDAVSEREFDVALGARVISKEGKRIQVTI